MRHFLLHEHVRYDACNMSAARESLIGEDRHEPDVPPAIDKTIITAYEFARHLSGSIRVFGARSEPRSGEDADVFFHFVLLAGAASRVAVCTREASGSAPRAA